MIQYFYRTNSHNKTGQVADYSTLKAEVKKNTFVCMLLQNPSEKNIKAICSEYDIQERSFKKFRNEKRSMRYNFDPLIFTFVDYYIFNEKVKTSHLLFIIKKNLLILVSSEESSYYTDLFSKVTQKTATKKGYSEGYMLYEFLHQDARENYDVLESIDDKIAQLEHKVLYHIDEKTVTHDILSLKKELIQVSKSLWASSKIIFTIKKDLTPLALTSEDMALLEDIYDTFMHQIDLIETQKETVTDYLSIFTTTISNKLASTSNELNRVMKKMAALTIILMVPTLIAGIYGTNFHFLPEITWQYGYLYMWLAMIISVAATYISFHKRQWI